MLGARIFIVDLFDAYLDFILAIRKDICGKTPKKEDVILNILQNKEELKKFKELMKSRG